MAGSSTIRRPRVPRTTTSRAETWGSVEDPDIGSRCNCYARPDGQRAGSERSESAAPSRLLHFVHWHVLCSFISCVHGSFCRASADPVSSTPIGLYGKKSPMQPTTKPHSPSANGNKQVPVSIFKTSLRQWQAKYKAERLNQAPEAGKAPDRPARD